MSEATTTTKAKNAKVKTPKFRVSYPSILEPRENELSGKMEYSLVALFPKGADLSALKTAAIEALKKKFGDNEKKWPSGLRLPFRDQAEKGKEDDNGNVSLPEGHEAGAIFMNLKSNQKPGLVDQRLQSIESESEFYPGCYAIASVNAYAYDVKGNRGVSFGLGNLQKVAEGEPLSGRTRPEDDFEAIEVDGNTKTDSDATSLFS